MKPLGIETNQKSRTQDGVDPKEERQLDQNDRKLWYIIRRCQQPCLFTCTNDFGAVPGCKNTSIRARSIEGDEWRVYQY